MLEAQVTPLTVAARHASRAGGAAMLQSPAHIALLGYTTVIQACCNLCAIAALESEAAVAMCRTVPLLTGAGRILLEASAAGGGSTASDCVDGALQQLAALHQCVGALHKLRKSGRPVPNAGALFQPAPVLLWIEALTSALLAGHAHAPMSGTPAPTLPLHCAAAQFVADRA